MHQRSGTPLNSRRAGCGFSTLGVPLHAQRSVWSAVAALSVYFAASMARDLSLYDSGELALAAAQLGLAHPPGQPLHTLLGFALSHLPLVPPLVGINLLSALPAAITLVPATSLGQRLLGPNASAVALRCMPWLLAVCALHMCVWEPATRIEVYSLASLGAVWALAAVAALDDIEGLGILHARVFQLGIALGLTASVNPLIALIAAIAIVPAVAVRLIARKSLSAAALAIGGGLVGLLPYVYLPLVATRTDVMVWGAPNTLASYLHYLTLRDYAHNQGIALADWLDHCGEWLRWAIGLGLAPLIALGFIAHLTSDAPWSHRIGAPLMFLVSLGSIAMNVVWHVDVPDYNGYMAGGFWALAAGAIALGTRPYANSRRQLSMLALAITCLLAALCAPPHLFARTRSTDRLARELAARVLAQAPQDAIVISETDAITGALFYLQGAERARPDVIVLAYGLASSSWHWEQLQRQHPGVRAVALQAGGGRSRRVKLWLDANAARPVLVERFTTARLLGLSPCPGDLFLQAGAACLREPRQTPALAHFIEERLAKLGEGSPSVAGLLAQTTYELGEALWKLGDARAAHALLLAGVPRQLWPAHVLARGPASASGPPRAAASMYFERPAALGDPGRNLFLAGAIAAAAGERELAREYVAAAAATGLPEATRLMSR